MNAPANLNTPKFKGHVLIAVVSYGPRIDYRVKDAVEASCFELANNGWLVTPATKPGSADLEDNRNVIAAEVFATPHFTHCLMVDSDVSWEAGAALRLVSHPVDVVLGAYPKRSEGEGYPIRKLPGPLECVNPLTGHYHPNGIAKIAGGPAGLLRLSRQCIEKMVTAHADRWYGSPKTPGGKAWPLFEFDVIEHERISEDMNFCRKWRETGGDVWVDPHLKLHHHGDKTYSGCFADHMRELGMMLDPKSVVKIPPGDNSAAVNIS